MLSGMIGGMLILAVFFAGIFVDRYVLVGRTVKSTDETEEEAKQRKELQQSQEAFRTLMTYNIEDVYGTGVPRGGEDV